MNAALDHIDNVSQQLARMIENVRVEGHDEAVLNLDLLKLSVLALCRQLLPKESRKISSGIEAEMDAQADALLKDRELVYAIVNITQRPISVTYLYLRAFSVWNQIANSDEEVARLRHFALALIFIAYDIASFYDQGKLALEELAHKALATDMALREALPALSNIHDQALRQIQNRA
jgi:hypothetical protein